MSKMCNLDIYIVIRDRDCDKVIQYQSTCSETGELFDSSKALEIVSDVNPGGVARHQKIYTNDDYDDLCVN